MKLLDVPLPRPRLNETTAASGTGTGPWLAGVGPTRALHVESAATGAGAMLPTLSRAGTPVRPCIRTGQGSRHTPAIAAVGAPPPVPYETARVVAG